MFPNLKPTFGTPANNTSFGFSSNVTPNPFGQSAFGKPATTGFGTPSAGFGSTSTPLFGSTAQHGSLFASAAPTATFGQPATTQPTFGSGMFGNTAAQPISSGLFGAASTSTFGQQNKTAGFGFGSNTGNTGFFGQSAAQQPQQSTGLFGQTSSNLFGGSAGFGGNTNSQMGTVLKFTPVTGTDTMVKGSINQTISTRHHCITCMKEYENKSLEELRWEDYQVNRKGPQQGAQPSTGLFGNMSQPVGGGLFGAGAVATSSNTLFGQQENKSVFGTAAPTGAFGQANTGFGAAPATNTASGLFGKPVGAFGTNTTSTASTFPFTSTPQTNNLFGTNTAGKTFGATTQSSSLFGQPAATGFGAQPTFGSFAPNTAQNTGLFNQNKTTPFNIGTSTNIGFNSFAQPATQNAGSLFSGVKTTSGFGGFGSTTTAPAFGQAPFGQTNQPLFNSTFNKPAAPLFGATNTNNALGTGLSMGTGTSLFGNTANKPNTMFGNSLGMFNSGFGNTAANPSFNSGGTGIQPGVAGADPNQASGEQQILNMSSTPYGLSNLLNNVAEVDNDLKDSTRPTNPGELIALLNTVSKSPTNSPAEKLQPVQVFSRKIPMFDGLEHKDESLVSNIRVNNNPKRLVLRKNLDNNDDDFNRPGSNWLASENDDTPNKFGNLMNNYLKDNILDTVDLTKDDKLTTSFDSKNNSHADVSELRPSLSSTRITSPAKALYISPEPENEEDTDNRDDDTDLFAEASELQDWNQDGSVNLTLDDHSNLNNSNVNSFSKHTADPHPTGITLTRPEYYTVPSLDELVKYIGEDGTCVVKGFTVGREGYGNVYFLDAFDVSNLNIDELVHFRHKEINIYPDETKKPPVGQGLNRRAQVTLDKVWPFDKKAKALVTDVETLSKIDYAGRLRRLSEKQNTRFVEYRPDTGSWVFKVEHFSKYGHRDSDESDDDSTVQKAESQLPGQTVAGKSEDKGLNKPEIVGAAVAKEIVGLRNIAEAPFAPHQIHSDSADVFICDDVYDTYSPTLAMKSADPAKCTLMKSTFFESEMDEYDDMSDAVSTVGGLIEIANYVSKSSPRRPELQIEENYNETHLAMDIFEENINSSICIPEQPETIPVSLLTGILPISQSYINNCNIADAAAFKGRSFKVGWGKNMTLLCLSTYNNIEGDKSSEDPVLYSTSPCSSTIMQCVSVKKLENFLSTTSEHFIEKHLESQLSFSKVEIVNEVPYFSSVSGCQLLESHQDLLKSMPHTDYHKQIWDLCVTLWGTINDDDLHKFDNRVIRRELFSTWLRNVVNKSVNDELDWTNKDFQSNILTCISGNRINEAAKLAVDNKNFNLSLFISQLPSNLSLRAYMEKQLELWNQSNVYYNIDTVLLKLFMIVAGKLFANYDNNSVCVHEGMDWMRILAMHFWYVIEPAKPLSDAVNMYERTFTDNMHTAKPLPSYDCAEDDVYDLKFQLLKFYSDNTHALIHVLNPFTHTNDALDYRLSWLLLQTLTSLGHDDISNQAKQHMHISFAAQLEQMGLWHWAIFVLLFIDEADVKKTHIMNIIDRHVELYNESSNEYRVRERMLVKDFHIPSDWIDSSRATLALLKSKYKEAIYYSFYAKHWQDTHDIIMMHLIPDHYLCYDYDFLIKLLTPLTEHKDLLANWDQTGGLMLDFAKLSVHYNQLIALNDPVSIKNNLTAFRSAILNVRSRIKGFPSLTYIHNVCLAEMSGRITMIILNKK
ncbi:Nucleoporin 98-96kD [Carabus blaptoides fortunei]